MKKYIYIVSLLLISCQEEITLNLPKAETKLVVQGAIENGFPPYVILTKSQGYFDPLDSINLSNIFVTDASVSVTRDDGEFRDLTLISQSEIDFLETYIGYKVEIPPNTIYIDLEGLLNPGFSLASRSYTLDIVWNNQSITAETTIPEPTPLDCLWVEKSETADEDFKFDIRGVYSDPADQQNNIITRSKRIEHYKRINDHSDSIQCEIINKPDGNLKLIDAGADLLINGETFEFYFPRPKDSGFPLGKYNGRHTKDCNGDLVEFSNDVVLIKYCQIDEPSLKFWRGLIRQAGTNGNPFAEPMNLVSNINNGLGIFTGYGSVYYNVPIIKDTVIYDAYTTDKGLNILDIF
mgnify:FL=1